MANDQLPGDTARQRVTIDDVLKAPSIPRGRELPPLTRIGYNLALYLLFYLAGVSVILLTDY